jgi:two-component system cell cycle response regulator DivK
VAGEDILIVDDNPVNQRLTRVLLVHEGYEVRCADDALHAFRLITERQPRLILMDLQLPGMDGLEATRRLKAEPATADIIIIALTAYAMKGDDAKARAAGCDGYITKPIDVVTLPGVIAAFLQAGDA